MKNLRFAIKKALLTSQKSREIYFYWIEVSESLTYLFSIVLRLELAPSSN